MKSISELTQKKDATRFILKDGSQNSLAKAFNMAEELNAIEEPDRERMKINKWRVGKTTETQLILDVDNQDEKNLSEVLINLRLLFPDENFTVIKTCHNDPNKFGYQIIGNEKSKASFVYKHLKVLNVDLKRDHDDIYKFKEFLEKFLKEFRANYPKPEKNLFNKMLFATGRIKPIGDIDYLYNVLATLNGKVSIRLTKKEENDKWEIIE